jgi:hypothetical protein
MPQPTEGKNWLSQPKPETVAVSEGTEYAIRKVADMGRRNG